MSDAIRDGVEFYRPGVSPEGEQPTAAVDGAPRVAPVCGCGAGSHAELSERCSKGHVITGNTAAMKDGTWAYSRGRGDAAVPAETRTSIQDFVQQVIADRGGPDGLTAIESAYCRRLGELETLARLVAADLAKRGVFTLKGRTRNTLSRWLEIIDRWDKYAQRIGADRRAKPVQSLRDYLQAASPEDRG